MELKNAVLCIFIGSNKISWTLRVKLLRGLEVRAKARRIEVGTC